MAQNPTTYQSQKTEVERTFEFSKLMAPVGGAALDNLNPPPPVAHGPHDARAPSFWVRRLKNSSGGFYNTEVLPTVAPEDITEAGYIIYPTKLRYTPFRVYWFLHFVLTGHAFLVIAAFLPWLGRNGYGAKKFLTCVRGNQSVEGVFCFVWAIVIDCNCSVAELAVRLSAASGVARIYSCHPTWQQKRSRYSSIDHVRPRHYTADMDISRVDVPSVHQRAANKALAVVRLWWPGAAYPYPMERTFFEPIGQGLLHVVPDHV